MAGQRSSKSTLPSRVLFGRGLPTSHVFKFWKINASVLFAYMTVPWLQLKEFMCECFLGPTMHPLLPRPTKHWCPSHTQPPRVSTV